MHHRITYMHINFQPNRVSRSVKKYAQIYLQADFEFNRPIYQITPKRKYFHRRQTDGQMNRRRVRQQ